MSFFIKIAQSNCEDTDQPLWILNFFLFLFCVTFCSACRLIIYHVVSLCSFSETTVFNHISSKYLSSIARRLFTELHVFISFFFRTSRVNKELFYFVRTAKTRTALCVQSPCLFTGPLSHMRVSKDKKSLPTRTFSCHMVSFI